jgi:hypothetical protein
MDEPVAGASRSADADLRISPSPTSADPPNAF